ncbi:MAG: 4Fe-4S binding protein [Deltaproteobacteria bacterium]|nr:4Fe-4S binding protein [Deltaproteobacteria bacterium]MBW2071404.1 4Fe-4S binding protein [Deltaproteobacteria bacterium]
MKTVFVNPERCLGCHQCEIACAVAHSSSKEVSLALWEEPLPRRRIHVEPGPTYNTSFANKCRHCNPAPCEQVCPTGAIHRQQDHDLVLITATKCIACAMCAMVCPFDVLTYYPVAETGPQRVVAVKCDGCVDRLSRGDIPACVEACKAEALVFGELNELLKAGRLRESYAVVAATTMMEGQAPAVPETVHAWRAWGASAEEATQGGGER